MENADRTDPELLAEWLDKRREPAFHALVARYAGLVLMTARRTCGDETLAAEASQLTFILLAQRAGSLLSCASLGGWLHRAALMHSRNLLRSRLREQRKRSELQAAAMTDSPSSSRPDASWHELQPVLDQALAALPDKDREALLLRFYRSLGVKEVGATLGISTDAAQKRIDRATGRLRDYLTRRGIQAGGSLAGVMLAGFAADAQAAVPAVAGFVSQALATGTATSLAGSSSLAAALSMKATSVVTPLVVLLVAGVWLGSQRLSMADLEKRNADLLAKLASAPAPASSGKKRIPAKTALEERPIDWKKVVRQIEEGASPGGAGGPNRYLSPNLRLLEGFKGMSREELLKSLEEITTADLSAEEYRTLETVLYGELLPIDPEAVLSRALSRDEDSTTHSAYLGHWAARDLAAASAWLDRQIASGAAEDKGLGGGYWTRIRFERELLFETLKDDPAALSKRLAALPSEERVKVFQQTLPSDRLNELDVTELARVVREQLPEADHLNVITWPVTERGETGTTGFGEVEDYFTKIQASPAERAACIMGIALRGRFPRASGDPFKVQAGDLEGLREWTARTEPGLAAKVSAAALGKALGQMEYPEAVTFALKCHAEDGGDAILEAGRDPSYMKKSAALAREVASKLENPQTRERMLKKLEAP